MREIVDEIRRWQDRGEAVALATVVQTWGSAPRKVGAKMAISENGRMVGSVSGGCIEGAVAEKTMEVLKGGPPQLLEFGVADELAWEVGLACGGSLRVFVEALDDQIYPAIERLVGQERSFAVVTLLAGPAEMVGRKQLILEQGDPIGTFGADFDAGVMAALQAAMAEGRSQAVELEGSGDELFIDVLLPPPTLVMVGGVHIAIALTAIAKTLGYRTVVIDPRHAFGSGDRFAHVDRLIQACPEEAFAQLTLDNATAIALLTHDPKIDDPALNVVLRSPAFYVGALGSRTTHAERVKRLREQGIEDALIDRIQGPIGLDINAQTPEEIAVAIMAQIISKRHRPI